MKRYITIFIYAFVSCELVELVYNFFYKENPEQVMNGLVTSALIAVCISGILNSIKLKKESTLPNSTEK